MKSGDAPKSKRLFLYRNHLYNSRIIEETPILARALPHPSLNIAVELDQTEDTERGEKYGEHKELHFILRDRCRIRIELFTGWGSLRSHERLLDLLGRSRSWLLPFIIKKERAYHQHNKEWDPSQSAQSSGWSVLDSQRRASQHKHHRHPSDEETK